jgi:hypothetical protein
MLSGLGGMVAQGMALGTGSALAHRAVDAVFSSSRPEPAQAQAAAQVGGLDGRGYAAHSVLSLQDLLLSSGAAHCHPWSRYFSPGQERESFRWKTCFLCGYGKEVPHPGRRTS